jgi:LTXXQ motif family protein
MTIRFKLVPALRSAVVFSSMIAVAPAAAQSSQRAAGSAPAPPTVLGPAMLHPGTADLSCGAGPAGLGPWGAERIEQTLSLDGSQRAKFNDLKTASQRAIQYLNESCPKNDPVTPIGRLEAMERRLSAMLEAVRTIQPALDDFYAALTDEQKARLAAIEPLGNTADSSTYRDRRGRVHQRRGGGRHFRFQLPLPF